MFSKTIKYLVLLYFIVFGLKLYAQTDSVLNNQMKFDFGLVRDKNRHIWPLIYKHKTKDYKDLQLLFTIYRKYQSYEIPYKHSHLLPFFWYDSSSSKKDLRIGTLYYPSLFRILNDTATQSKSFRLMELAPEINLLNITKSKTGLFTQNNLFFFIWSKNDVLKNKSNFIVFPIYWYYRNNYRTTNTFFPLYRYVKINDRNEQNFSFYPGLYFYKQENKTIRHSLALVFYHKKYEQYQTTKLAQKTVLFPLLFTINNLKEFKFTLFPLVHYDKHKSKQNFRLNLAVTPLFWHKQTNQFNRNVLFPIYWQKKQFTNNDTNRRTFVFPVYYSSVSSLFKEKYYIPFVFYNRSFSDTSLTVFPLFYKGSNYQKKYNVFLPLYYYKNDFLNKEKTFAITPFYWNSKAVNYQSKLLFPLWYKMKYEAKNDTHYTQNFVPFVFYKRVNRDKKFAIIPIYYQKRDGIYGDTTTYIFPNYISYKNDEEQFRTFLPIYFSNKNENEKIKVLLPIWYYKNNFRNNDTNFTNVLFPLYYSFKEKNANWKLLFPIIWVSKFNEKYRHENTIAVVPFYYKNVLDSTSKTLGITPFYWFTYSKQSGLNKTQTSKTLFPFWWYKNILDSGNSISKSNTIFPLYFSKSEGNYKHQVLFPIIWKYKDTAYLNSYKSLTIFPFYQSYKLLDNSYKLNAYTPLVWKIKSKNEKQFVVFPLVWTNTQIQTLDTVKNTVIFPVYWRHISSFYNNTTLFPLYWNLNNYKRKVLTVLPFYFKKYDSITQTKSLVIVPIFFSKKDLNQSAKVVFPLWYNFKNDSTQSKTLFPFWWYKNETINGIKNKSNSIIPIYFSKTEGTYKHQVLFPIIWKYKDTSFKSLTIFPIYQNYVLSNNRYQLSAYTPFFWRVKAKNENKYFIFPFVWSDKRNEGDDTLKNTVIFPFFWDYKSNYYHNTTLFPLYWKYKNYERTAVTILPFLYFDKYGNDSSMIKHMVIFPLFYKTKSLNYNQTTLLPIYFAKKTKEENNKVLFPFWYSYKNKIDTTKVLFPLYFSYKDTNQNNKILFPLWYSFKNDSIQSRTFFPIWWLKKSTINGIKTTSNDIFPIYFSKKEGNYSHKVLFPIVWKYQDTNYKSLTVFPVYQNYVLANKSYQLNAYTPFFWRVRALNDNRFVVFPFVWKVNKTMNNDTVKNTVVFPFYWNYKSSFHHNTVLFPLYWKYKNNERTATTIFPLLYFDKKGTDSNAVKHSIVFPLFYKTKSLNYNYTSLFPFYFAKKTKEENNKVLFPLWYSYKNKIDTTKLLIPFFLKYKKHGITTTGITPLYWHLEGTNFKKDIVFPLWWSKSNLTISVKTLLPIFYYKTNIIDSSKILGITPFYWYFKENAYVTKTLYPFWYLTKYPNYYSNFLFPLYYYNSNNGKKTFNIFPLFYSSASNKKKSYLLFPLYFHNKEINGNKVTSNTMLTPLVWINKDSSSEIKNNFRVLPFFKHTFIKQGEFSETNNNFFLLYYSTNRIYGLSTYYKYKTIMLLAWRFKTENSSSFTLFPIYHFNKKINEQNLAITPLFWNIKNKKKEQNLLWPIYNYNKQKNNTRFNIAYILYRSQQTDKVHTWSMFWPIVQHIKGNHYSYFHIAPIIWYKKSDSMNYFSIQPLLFSQKTNEFKRLQVLWQLYSYKKTFGLKTSNSFLWNTYFKTNYNNGDFETRFLYKAYANIKKDSSTEKILFPIYNVQKQKNGDYYKAYFLNMYQKTKTQVPNTSEYYLEEKVLWYIRLRSNFNYLKQKGVITTRKFK